MAVIEKYLEKAVALSVGACVLGFGIQGGGSYVGLAAAGAGLAAVAIEATRRHGPESRARIRSLSRKVEADLSAEFGRAEQPELQAAAQALADVLTPMFPPPDELARLTLDARGFPTAATELILGKVIQADARFAAGVWQRFAEALIARALAVAFEDRGYFQKLEPRLWREAMAAFGRIEQRLDQILARLGLPGGQQTQLKAQALASLDPAQSEAFFRRFEREIGRLGDGADRLEAVAALLESATRGMAGDAGVKPWAIAGAAAAVLAAVLIGVVIVQNQRTNSPSAREAREAERVAALLDRLNGRWGEAGCAGPYDITYKDGVITFLKGDYRSLGTLVNVEGEIIKSETLEPSADRGKSVWMTLSRDPARDYLTINDRNSDTSVRWERCK